MEQENEVISTEGQEPSEDGKVEGQIEYPAETTEGQEPEKVEESETVIEETAENPNEIVRKGYKIVFVSPSDEQTLNDLRNTGRCFGEIHSTCETSNQDDDEIIIAVKI